MTSANTTTQQIDVKSNRSKWRRRCLISIGSVLMAVGTAFFGNTDFEPLYRNAPAALFWGWTTHQSTLSPDETQRAKIVIERGFMDDNAFLKITGGPANGAFLHLGEFFGNTTQSSFRICWTSNRELRAANCSGSLEDWAVVRITNNGVSIDQPTSNNASSSERSNTNERIQDRGRSPSVLSC